MSILYIPVATDLRIAGVQIIDPGAFLELVVRFTINTGVILILIKWLYLSGSKRKDYLFTYILISSIVFLLCFLLESVKLQVGFALGLFAIFGILRYRTNTIPIKEMTYLFLVIGISVINALASTKTSVADLLFTNLAVIGITYFIEKVWLSTREYSKMIIYEKIDLIKPERHEELMKDLRERTGIASINRFEISKIDLQKDICFIKIYYIPGRDEIAPVENDENNFYYDE